MAFDNGAGDGQAQAHAAGLGGGQRLEYAVDLVVGDAGAIVLDADAILGVGQRAADDDHLGCGMVFEGFDGVAGQVDHRLLELDALGQNPIVVRRHIHADGHALGGSDHHEDGAEVLDHRGGPFAVQLASFQGQKFAHPSDDLARAQKLPLGQLDGAQGAVAQGAGLFHVHLAGVQIGGGGAQRLVQFMSQGGGHLA